MDRYAGGTVKLKFAHLYEDVFLPIIKAVMDNHDEYRTLKIVYRASHRNKELHQFVL